MTKKWLLVLVIAVFAAEGSFAQFSFSVGGGGFFADDSNGGVRSRSFLLYDAWMIPCDYKFSYSGGGAYVFFDAAYVEASLGFFFGGGEMMVDEPRNWYLDYRKSSVDFALTGFNIGLLYKYPLVIDRSWTLFPLLGIDIRSVLSAKIDGKDYEGILNDNGKPGDFTALWLQFGGGVDYSLRSNIFLRGEVFFGYRFINKVENDIIDGWRDDLGVDIHIGYGLTIKLAIGFRIY
jgi:hypothetical protein